MNYSRATFNINQVTSINRDTVTKVKENSNISLYILVASSYTSLKREEFSTSI